MLPGGGAQRSSFILRRDPSTADWIGVRLCLEGANHHPSCHLAEEPMRERQQTLVQSAADTASLAKNPACAEDLLLFWRYCKKHGGQFDR